jgi:hypothetical protein
MLEINNDVGRLENVFRLGKLKKGTHTCKYTFSYLENGNSHACFMTDLVDNSNRHIGDISMGTIRLGWDGDTWSVKDCNSDKEYFKIFINMLKCIERELEIKLPKGLFK